MDRTDEAYIETDALGTFSNSATRESYLYVKLTVTKKSIGIFLHEYERDRPAQYFIGDEGVLRLKNSTGQTLTIRSLGKWNDSGGISVWNDQYAKKWDRSNLVAFLKKSVGKVQVYMHDGYSSTYNFEIDCTGFTHEYNNL